AAVAGGPGLRAGGIGPDPVAGAVEVQYRSTAGGDGVYAHHRRANAHAGDQRLEDALELPVEVRDVGRSPAHVEAYDAVETARERGAHRPHHTSGGAGE